VADAEKDPNEDGLRWNGHRVPLVSLVASWFTKDGTRIHILDLIAVAVLAAAIFFLVTHVFQPGSSNGTTGEVAGGDSGVGAIEEANQPVAATKGAESASGTVVEYADNRDGSPVYAGPSGEPAEGPGVIPYGTKVEVSCYAPDRSGMDSVNGFYRISGGPWDGDYVVADTMTNGGKVGDRSSPARDERVHECGEAE
jgi:hypothetical protein